MNHFKLLVLAAALAVFAMVPPASAGPLSTDANSYLGVWHGSTSFQGYDTDGVTPTGLTGYIDWAVYAPGQFPAGFTSATLPPAGEYLYAYQAYETNVAPLSSMLVVIGGPADTILTFTATGITGLAPNGMTLTTNVSALWTFDGVPNGGSTAGVAFFSPNAPTTSVGFTVDDGSIGISVPLPAPNPTNIPEPGTLTLALCGIVPGILRVARRRQKRVGS